MEKNKLMTLVWAGDFLSKPVYFFIAWQQYQSGSVPDARTSLPGMIFLALGILDAIAGFLLVRDLSKSNPSFLPFYEKWVEKTPAADRTDPRFGQFAMAIGLMETTALFSLISYMVTGNAGNSLILAGIWFIFWILSRPSAGTGN